MIKEDIYHEKNAQPPDTSVEQPLHWSEKIPDYYEFRRNTIQEMQGVFAKSELDTIIPFVKHTIADMSPEPDKNFFMANCRTYYEEDDSKLLDEEAFIVLLNKIDRMNIAQLYFLQEEIFHMWVRKDPFRYLYSLFLS